MQSPLRRRFSRCGVFGSAREIRLERLETRHPLAADAAIWAGDANADGQFNSADLVLAFQHGKYETNASAHWDQGDWNLDRRFTSNDLVIAFQTGRYGRSLNAEPDVESPADPGTGETGGGDSGAGDPGDRDPGDSNGGDAGAGDPGAGDSGSGVVPGALANDDAVSRTLEAGATRIPSLEIDVLANDSAEVMEIRSISDPMLGTVERLPGAGPNGRELLRYVPGPNFRYWDRFSYTVVDAAGEEATAWVLVNFTQDSAASLFAAEVPSAVATDAGTPVALRNESGEALVRVDYAGPDDVSVGVHIFWRAPDVPYSGDVFAGKFSSTEVGTETSGFSEIAGGGAWVWGSVAEVNRLLSGLRYEPAAGFSTTNGYVVNMNTFLYSSLRINLGMESDSFRVLVRAAEGAPQAVDDVFEVYDMAIGQPIELDVTANDYANGRELLGLGEVELLSVDKSDYSHGTLELDPATGKLSYTPDWSFNGFDTFSYVVRNADGVISQGRAAIRGTNLLVRDPFDVADDPRIRDRGR